MERWRNYHPGRREKADTPREECVDGGVGEREGERERDRQRGRGTKNQGNRNGQIDSINLLATETAFYAVDC